MTEKKETRVLSFIEKKIHFSIILSNKKIDAITITLSDKNKNKIIPPEYNYIYQQFYNYLCHGSWKFNLPMNWEKLTPFQLKVYKETMKVNPGRVASYGEIAKRIGGTKYSRAVGIALSRNPFPIVIPCHRIVPSSFNRNKIGGFSSGVELKRVLLLIENPDIFA